MVLLLFHIFAWFGVISLGNAYNGMNLKRSGSMHRRHQSLSGKVLDWSADAVNMSQEDFMMKDQCLLVDDNDNIIGSASKYDSHRFTQKNPGGLLHRAFSVFLFDHENNLLLQQRASDKITFPDVWTNTCCSHPLYGYKPDEVDDEAAVSSGNVDGIKHAAIRKLKHELGIDTPEITINEMKYLTRIHYSADCGDDTTTDGSNDESERGDKWGESEIDYVLFCRVPRKVIEDTLDLNPEEIQATKFVNYEELKAMMADPALQWSPWFRVIVDSLLKTWWEDVGATLSTDAFVDYSTIHRFL